MVNFTANAVATGTSALNLVNVQVADAGGSPAANTPQDGLVAVTGEGPPPALVADGDGSYSGLVGVPIQFFGSATGGMDTYKPRGGTLK